jgi:hypothetical protein
MGGTSFDRSCPISCTGSNTITTGTKTITVNPNAIPKDTPVGTFTNTPTGTPAGTFTNTPTGTLADAPAEKLTPNKFKPQHLGNESKKEVLCI